jgi:biotin operon repressor
LSVYIREDENIIYKLAEAILTVITRKRAYQLGGIWSESEFLVDWLMSESSIGKIIKRETLNENFGLTIQSTRTKQSAKVLQKSADFYTKLGIPSFDRSFGLNDLVPEINKKPIENLSAGEKVILQKLIKNSNQIVTFDQIADEFSTSDEDFSLYAISKTIERLRNKLEANGISGSYIQTLRGKGYLLKN